LRDWKVVTKESKWLNPKTQKIETKIDELPFQEDEQGNIYQKRGGVQAKACQKCGVELGGTVKDYPLIQKYPLYKCTVCDYKKPGADNALDHIALNKEHTMSKVGEERIVGHKRISEGNIAQVTITEDDVIIRCPKCAGD